MSTPFRPKTFAPAWSIEIMRHTVRTYFRLFHFTKWRGKETLPPPGPCLFAANHQSYYDPMPIAAGQDLMMKFMAWDALFKGDFTGQFLRDWGAFPVDPYGSDPGGYRTCLDHLKKGERILIFPEAERSYDGKLLPFREGVARLAMKADVAVVPVCVCGANRAWPRGDATPRPFFRINVTYLPPIYPRPVKTAAERRDEAKRITDEIVNAIQRCLDAYDKK